MAGTGAGADDGPAAAQATRTGNKRDAAIATRSIFGFMNRYNSNLNLTFVAKNI